MLIAPLLWSIRPIYCTTFLAPVILTRIDFQWAEGPSNGTEPNKISNNHKSIYFPKQDINQSVAAGVGDDANKLLG